MRGKSSEDPSLLKRGLDKLKAQFRAGFGRSKHNDKQSEAGIKDRIYSNTTFKTYAAAWCDFCQTMREVGYTCNGHRPRKLEEAVTFVPIYLEILKNRPGLMGAEKMSAYSIWTKFSGVAKVLELCASDYDLPPRHSTEIRRSRLATKSDSHFSEVRNSTLVTFCRTTGLRHNKELHKIRGSDLHEPEGDRPYILVKGKGGRIREAHLYGTDEEIALVVELMHAAGPDKVWPKTSQNADVHSYRADYAVRVYRTYVRDLSLLSYHQLYFCRGEKKGTAYDRRALRIASRELGHSRVSVVALYYLHGLTKEETHR